MKDEVPIIGRRDFHGFSTLENHQSSITNQAMPAWQSSFSAEYCTINGKITCWSEVDGKYLGYLNEGSLSRGQAEDMLGVGFHDAEALFNHCGANQKPTWEEQEQCTQAFKSYLDRLPKVISE